MQRPETLGLREAARRTARSVTTLRRYIRQGRMSADKRPGRFGPEYCVSPAALAGAGLALGDAEALPFAPERAPAGGARLPAALGDPGVERWLREAVPLLLYQELQLKHEQLLVQYGMIRAGGLRALELEAQVQELCTALDDARAQLARAGERTRQELDSLRTRLRETELELEGRALTIDALREKVRTLEMLTRNAVRSETLEKQFSEVMAQARRVDALSVEATREGRPDDADH